MKKALVLLMLLFVLIFACDVTKEYEVEKEEIKMEEEQTNEPEIVEESIRILDHTTYGKILANNKGLPIYHLVFDFRLESTCEGDCLSSWPVFFSKILKLDKYLDQDDFGTIRRMDGASQTTYKGWPL